MIRPLRSLPNFHCSLIQRLGLNQTVRLLPNSHFARIAIEPAIADDAVLLRLPPRENRCLCRASDRRHNLSQLAGPALVRQFLQPPRTWKQFLREADSEDENKWL